jgi:ribonuclease HI
MLVKELTTYMSLRDTNGKWLKEFVRKIGVCDALHAEMWGLYSGLELAWQVGVSHLCVEGDSKLLIDMVTNNCKTNGTTPSLMRRIRNLLDRSWHVEIHHTWWEGNRSADWLANFSLTMDSWDFVVLKTPPSELNSLLFDDISGACMPRNVRLVV